MPEVARLGVNLSGREVERLADLFLAVEEVALEQGIYENVDHISVGPDNWWGGDVVPSGPATRRIKRRDSHSNRSSPGSVTTIWRPI